MTTHSTLIEAARILKLHPRTILRAISRKPNPYWAPGYDEPVFIRDLVRVFNARSTLLAAVFLDRKPLLTPTDGAKLLKLNYDTFRKRRYPAVIRKGHIVRYSAIELKAIDRDRTDLKTILS